MMKELLMLLVKGYRLILSPWLGSSCRFTPTCSAYALEALDSHGAAKGSYLTLRRLSRCHPWCDGGHDPVPKPHNVTTTLSSTLPSIADTP
jgi:putative membrane protein insertion efficiency factor